MNKPTSSDEIAIFVSVVERGSFAAAAEASGLTPSGVSRVVTRLEDHLGVRLLERTTRRLKLTPEGETLLARGREVLATLEALETEVSSTRGRPRGLIRVATGTAFAQHRLAPALPEFRARYPEIDLDLTVSDRRVDVIGDQIDVAIRTGPLADSTLIARRIGTSKRIIAAAPAYLARYGTPEHPRDLERHTCLRIAGASYLSEWPMRVDGVVVPWAVRGGISCDSAQTLHEMAVAGLGIVRIAGFIMTEALERGRLVSLLDAYHVPEDVPFWALIPPGRQDMPRVRAFVDFVAEIARKSSGPL
jgi:DNA-binding transcriptional LysR family regulator